MVRWREPENVLSGKAQFESNSRHMAKTGLKSWGLRSSQALILSRGKNAPVSSSIEARVKGPSCLPRNTSMNSHPVAAEHGSFPTLASGQSMPISSRSSRRADAS